MPAYLNRAGVLHRYSPWSVPVPREAVKFREFDIYSEPGVVREGLFDKDFTVDFESKPVRLAVSKLFKPKGRSFQQCPTMLAKMRQAYGRLAAWATAMEEQGCVIPLDEYLVEFAEA